MGWEDEYNICNKKLNLFWLRSLNPPILLLEISDSAIFPACHPADIYIYDTRFNLPNSTIDIRKLEAW